jgi:hypothetical protein
MDGCLYMSSICCYRVFNSWKFRDVTDIWYMFLYMFCISGVRYLTSLTCIFQWAMHAFHVVNDTFLQSYMWEWGFAVICIVFRFRSANFIYANALWKKSGLETWGYGHRDPSRRSRGTLYPQKLALTSPTGGRRSACIVRSRTQATECFMEEVTCVAWIITALILRVFYSHNLKNVPLPKLLKSSKKLELY